MDWIGLSFVRSANDILELKSKIRAFDPTILTKVVAKIEKPEAIFQIDEIIKETDAVMVARGDLGVEIPMHEVAGCSKNDCEQMPGTIKARNHRYANDGEYDP